MWAVGCTARHTCAALVGTVRTPYEYYASTDYSTWLSVILSTRVEEVLRDLSRRFMMNLETFPDRITFLRGNITKSFEFPD